MSWFKKLIGKKEGFSLSTDELVDVNLCPNCWGRQEYHSKFIQKYEDHTKSNINHEKTHRKAFIQQFVETHVSGIHLKSDGDKISCPRCNTTF